jgi:predicted glutamine amidotransferase
MCRLAAFPPGFPRQEAIKILRFFAHGNSDGVGSAHLSHGKFVVDKWPYSLNRVLREEKPFLHHMPHDGWTIAHLRAASHGNNSKRNTHPFVVDNWAFIHNGVWWEHNVVKLALRRSGLIKFDGETDSEVAAHLLNISGPKKFTEEIEMGGVFMALNKDGSLHVMKTSGDLESVFVGEKQFLLASEFNSRKYLNRQQVNWGWYKFNPEGEIKFKRYKEMPPIETPTTEIYDKDFDEEDWEDLMSQGLLIPQSRNEFKELRPLTRAELEQSIPPKPLSTPYGGCHPAPFCHGFD